MKRLEKFTEALVGKTIRRVIMDHNEVTLVFDDDSLLTIERCPLTEKLDIQFDGKATDRLTRKCV